MEAKREGKREDTRTDGLPVSSGNVGDPHICEKRATVETKSSAKKTAQNISVVGALALTFRLASLALVGVLPIAVQVMWRSYSLPHLSLAAPLDVDIYNREVVIFPNQTAWRRLSECAAFSPAFLSLSSLFPLLAHLYVPGRFAFRHVVLVCATCLFILLAGYGIMGIKLIKPLIMTLSVMATLLFARYLLPASSKITGHLVFHLCIIMSASFVFGIFDLDPEVFVFILPIFREAARIMSTISAWYLSSDAHCPGVGVEARRENAWIFVGYVQLVISFVFRLQVGAIISTHLALFLVAYKSAIELLMRLTVRVRDRKIKAAGTSFKRAFSLSMVSLNRRASASKQTASVKPLHRIGTVIVDLSDTLQEGEKKDTHKSVQDDGLNLTRAASKTNGRAEAINSFYSLITLTEMTAEYTAIVTAPLIIIFYREKVLLRPYAWHKGVEKPFDENGHPSIENLLFMTLVQIFCEVVVDVICICYESRNGLRLKWTWVNRPKNYAYVFAFLSLAMFSISDTIVLGSFSPVYTCASKASSGNMCDCVFEYERFKKSLWAEYCLLLYPANEGRFSV